MCKCLLWLNAQGRVQGLRSVTSSQCLFCITTLKTATRPQLHFFSNRMNVSYLWSGDTVTLGYCFNTCMAWWRGGGLCKIHRKGVILGSDYVKFVLLCVCVCVCVYLYLYLCEVHFEHRPYGVRTFSDGSSLFQRAVWGFKTFNG